MKLRLESEFRKDQERKASVETQIRDRDGQQVKGEREERAVSDKPATWVR